MFKTNEHKANINVTCFDAKILFNIIDKNSL